MARRKITAIVLLLALLANVSRAADSFDAVRSEVRTKPPETSDDSPPEEPKKKEKPADPVYSWQKPCDDDKDDEDNSWLVEGLVGGSILVASAPYWIPITALEHDDAGPLLFAPAPYEASDGWMMYTNPSEAPLDGYAWGSQIRAEYLDDYDGLTGYRGRLLTEHVSRWGIDTETNYWRQAISPGVHDELWTGDVNLVVRFAQNERVQMRSGAGVAWLADRVDSEFGFNFTYGGDFYPIKPLVISTELDAGWIGEAWLIHLRATAGVVYQQTEVYAGYDYLEIGNAQIDGFVAGLKFYF